MPNELFRPLLHDCWPINWSYSHFNLLKRIYHTITTISYLEKLTHIYTLHKVVNLSKTLIKHASHIFPAFPKEITS